MKDSEDTCQAYSEHYTLTPKIFRPTYKTVFHNSRDSIIGSENLGYERKEQVC